MNQYPEIPLKIHCPDSDFPQKLRSITPEVINRTLKIQNLKRDGVDLHFSLPLDLAIEVLGHNMGVDFRAEDWVGVEPHFLTELTFPLPLLSQVLDLILRSNGQLHFFDSSENPVYLTATINLRLILAIAMCQQNYDYTITVAQEKGGFQTLLLQE